MEQTAPDSDTLPNYPTLAIQEKAQIDNNFKAN